MSNKLILDYSKWRCGGYGDNQVGVGSTRMENSEGFSCCLGQFLPQLIPITSDKLLRKGYPANVVSGMAPDLYQNCILIQFETGYDTPLSDDAVRINDDEDTTPEQKIEKLKELFATVDYEIEVINKPE